MGAGCLVKGGCFLPLERHLMISRPDPHPPDLAGEPLPRRRRQPCRRAGHRPVHAGHRGLEDCFDPHQAPPRPACSAASSGASAIWDWRRWPKMPGRGVCRPGAQAQTPAGRDAPLRQGDHRPRRGEHLGQWKKNALAIVGQGRGRDGLRLHRCRNGGRWLNASPKFSQEAPIVIK
jgi:hypothetical protein